MIYDFICDGCSTKQDVDRPMSQAGDPALCPSCTAPMRRLFGHNSICDEIRGNSYFHPVKKAMVKDHGRRFDIGMGQWYTTKSERRQKAKALGLVEHGIREI